MWTSRGRWDGGMLGATTAPVEERFQRAPAAPPPSPLEFRADVEAPVRCLLPLWSLVGIPLIFAAIVAVRGLIWDDGRQASSLLEHVLVALSVTWMAPATVTAATLVGYALFRRPRGGERVVAPLDIPVCFRIVSRGANADAVRATVRNIRGTMAAIPAFPYSVEVVTDVPIDLPTGDDVRALVVPEDYSTVRGSLFKARALQYALDRSPVGERTWIMHLDEESHITRSLVVGIHAAIEEEDAAERPRIGQGLILYHRGLDSDRFFTLADSIRSGDDVGRFYIQHRLGVTLFGLHGSFVLCRTDVERAVGFDVGPEGSITEDAFWALEQMARGGRCRWVDGVVVEQAPQRLHDFLKQRRRWFIGLWKVVRHAPVPLRWRVPLAFSVAMWSVSWLGVIYTYLNLATGLRTPTAVWVAGSFAFAVYIAQYVVGLRLNMDHHGIKSRFRRLRLYVAQVALIPVFAVLEALGVLYAFVRPERGFHVIEKQRNP